jgi:hypothetical protein
MIRELIHTIEGDGVSKEFIIEHGLDTLNIIHQIYDANTLDTIMPGITRVDSNTVKISFMLPVETGEIYKVILWALKV